MENWSQLWLNYHPAKDKGLFRYAGEIRSSEDTPILKNAVRELSRGLSGITGAFKGSGDGFIELCRDDSLPHEGYSISPTEDRMVISGGDDRGILYGVFALLRSFALGKSPEEAKETASPDNPLRMLNHWDNMTSDIERGYSGESFFFEDGKILLNERTEDYARFCASVGINAVVINNVNVKGDASFLITERYFPELRQMSELFSSWGISLYLSLNFASPMEIGGLLTCDPLDASVKAWWSEKAEEIHRNIPGFGGFLVKADSEGRPGPFTYGRTQADGANMLADTVRPYGWLIIWRCFVYNCRQDWRDRKTDRAKAGYDSFIGSDGLYRDNVILQIKNGPMDFQIREPVSPLLLGLKNTNVMLEVQIAQEYTGHQIDVCCLLPLIREVLETQAGTGLPRVREIISGKAFGNGNRCGIAAVSNTGNDPNWTGSDLAAVNLYGFGRLAFDMDLSSEEIIREWAELTFKADAEAIGIIEKILTRSRAVYENYTTPFGLGWMVTPALHYGPSPMGYEYSAWGTYHRADHFGVGVERGIDGSGFAQQYPEPLAGIYNDPETCPEELLLFFHHVPYAFRLKDGRSLIQALYDCHFEGYQELLEMAEEAKALSGRIPEASFQNIKERFELQVQNAREWCDQVNSFFYRLSAIPDEHGREIY